MGSASSAASPRVGDMVGGKYRLVRRIGQGGMGSVWEAENTGLGRTLALKFLEPHLAKSPALVERFLREARSAATITHPNVVYVFDVGWVEDGRLPYMAMELLEGKPISQLVKEGGLPLARACSIASQILEALEAAHAKGIVHRDLKPANVFLVRGDVVKVLDFGISKMLGTGDNKLTATGSVLGTPSYMSPEQARGAKTVDQRTDLYGAGAILYEMLAGVAPYEGDSYNEILFKIATEDPPRIDVIRPDLPAFFGELLARALRRNPAERFASASEMRVALVEAASRASATATMGGWSPRPAATPPPTPPPTPAAWEITHPSDAGSEALTESSAPRLFTGAPGTADAGSLARTAPSGSGKGTQPTASGRGSIALVAGATAAVLLMVGLIVVMATRDPEPAAAADVVQAAAPAWKAPPAPPARERAAAPPTPQCRFLASVTTPGARVSFDGQPATAEIDRAAECGARAVIVAEAPGFRRLQRELEARPTVDGAIRLDLERVATPPPGTARRSTRSSTRRTDVPAAPPVQILEPNPFQR